MSELERRDRPIVVVASSRAERTAAREQAHMDQVRRTFAAQLEWGGPPADAVRAQVLRGEWIFYWSPVIDQLKREGRLVEAHQLATECVDLAERELAGNDCVPPPGWTEKLAIICRKMGRPDLEVEAIERWLVFWDAAHPGQPVGLHRRLIAARALRDKLRA